MNISQFLKDGRGDWSAQRLVFVCWGVGSFMLWAGVCLYTGLIAEIPASTAGLLAALVAGKVWQAHIEAREAAGNAGGESP